MLRAEQMALEATFKEVEHLRAALAAAHQRERIAVEAYERQQQSQREWEALYTAMTERAQITKAALALAVDIIGTDMRYVSAADERVMRDALAGAVPVEYLDTERRRLAQRLATDPRWQGGYDEALKLLEDAS